MRYCYTAVREIQSAFGLTQQCTVITVHSIMNNQQNNTINCKEIALQQIMLHSHNIELYVL